MEVGTFDKLSYIITRKVAFLFVTEGRGIYIKRQKETEKEKETGT